MYSVYRHFCVFSKSVTLEIREIFPSGLNVLLISSKADSSDLLEGVMQPVFFSNKKEDDEKSHFMMRLQWRGVGPVIVQEVQR
jgi:hypothetical protein